MKLLLDTHIWLWGLLEPERLTPVVARELEQADAELWLSPISVWETLLLAQEGRLRLEVDAQEWIDGQLGAMPMRDAVLTREIALRSRQLDLAHDDPADRFLAATAAVYDLVLVTADVRLVQSTSVQVLANR